MSVNKGKKTERDIAAYFTQNGCPTRREVRTGDADHADEGDLRPCPGVVIEAKNWSGDLTFGSVVTLLAKLEIQKRPGDLGLLVDRTDRVADPGRWRVWMTAADLSLLLQKSAAGSGVADPLRSGAGEPVAIRLHAVVRWLRDARYFLPVNPFDAG